MVKRLTTKFEEMKYTAMKNNIGLTEQVLRFSPCIIEVAKYYQTEKKFHHQNFLSLILLVIIQ